MEVLAFISLLGLGYKISENNTNKGQEEKNYRIIDNKVENFQNIYNNKIENTENNFTHNNMQPYFGSNVTQNIGDDIYSTKLGGFTGNYTDGSYKQHRETENMFKPVQTGGNVFGTPSANLRDRYIEPISRNNDKPFESINVGSGLGLDPSINSGGGYQQLNTQVYALPKNIDNLRTKNNPQISYTAPPIAGKVVNPNNIGIKGNITKNKQINYIENRLQLPNGGYISKPRYKSEELLNNNNRTTTTNVERYQPAGQSTKFIVSGKYRESNRNILNNIDSNRNMQASTKGSKLYNNFKNPNITNKEINSIKGGSELRNFIGKSINTIKNILYKPKTTIKETLLQPSTLLNPTGKLKMITRNNQQFRVTNKETTISNQHYGISKGNRKNNKQNFIIQNTNRQTTSNHEYIGHAGNTIYTANPDRTAVSNMDQNILKEQISKGRSPTNSNIKQSISKKDINVVITKNPLDTSQYNGLPTGINHIVNRESIHLSHIKDSLANELELQSYERINPEINMQLNTNPYNLDITKTL